MPTYIAVVGGDARQAYKIRETADMKPPVPIVNFAISENAVKGIALAREAFNRTSPDPAAVVTVGWGRFYPHSGPAFENVVVTFYAQSQLSEVRDAIQEASGLEVVFAPNPVDRAKFAGKVLDFLENDGFFLRNP